MNFDDPFTLETLAFAVIGVLALALLITGA
jgi:hypothetical protein